MTLWDAAQTLPGVLEAAQKEVGGYTALNSAHGGAQQQSLRWQAVRQSPCHTGLMRRAAAWRRVTCVLLATMQTDVQGSCESCASGSFAASKNSYPVHHVGICGRVAQAGGGALDVAYAGGGALHAAAKRPETGRHQHADDQRANDVAQEGAAPSAPAAKPGLFAIGGGSAPAVGLCCGPLTRSGACALLKLTEVLRSFFSPLCLASFAGTASSPAMVAGAKKQVGADRGSATLQGCGGDTAAMAAAMHCAKQERSETDPAAMLSPRMAPPANPSLPLREIVRHGRPLMRSAGE